MRIKHTKFLTKLLIFTMLLMVFSSAGFAEAAKAELPVPVRVILSGYPPADDEDYRIILEADNPNNPMPIGSIDGKYTMIITGEGSSKLPNIDFKSKGIGIYEYKIFQLAGTNRLASYDDAVYNLIVYVTNEKNGTGFETTAYLYLLDGNGSEVEGKREEVIFENDYDRPSRPDRPDEPDRPDRPDDPEPVEEIEEIPEPVPEGVPEPEAPIEEIEEIDEPIPLDVPEPPTGSRPDVPQTGDDTVIWPYIGLFISGAALLIILGSTVKKNEIEE